jgi:Zn finger protein HypA/HybF involved in hydrogenase expression
MKHVKNDLPLFPEIARQVPDLSKVQYKKAVVHRKIPTLEPPKVIKVAKAKTDKTSLIIKGMKRVRTISFIKPESFECCLDKNRSNLIAEGAKPNQQEHAHLLKCQWCFYLSVNTDKCCVTSDRLFAWAMGQIPTPDEQKHLLECPVCAYEYDELFSLGDSISCDVSYDTLVCEEEECIA